jgi:hypothetical protein
MAYVNVTEWRAEQVAEWLQGKILEFILKS